jgi:hypothetical protein
LRIPSEIIRIHAQYEGSIAYQFLSAAIVPYNPDNFELQLRLRCIKPELGKDVSAAVIHLKHGEAEIAPYRVEFPLVEARTTGEGTLYFEVSKNWKQVDILIYHGVADQTKMVQIPLQLD